jgi:hypothetical protein
LDASRPPRLFPHWWPLEGGFGAASWSARPTLPCLGGAGGPARPTLGTGAYTLRRQGPAARFPKGVYAGGWPLGALSLALGFPKVYHVWAPRG